MIVSGEVQRLLRRLEASAGALRARVDRMGGWLEVAAYAFLGALIGVLIAVLAALL